MASFFSKLLFASGAIESHLRTVLFQVFSQSFQVCEQHFTSALDGTSYNLLTQREVLLGLFVFESFRAFAAIEFNIFEGLFHDFWNFAFDKRAIPTVRTRILLASPSVNASCAKQPFALFTGGRIPNYVTANLVNIAVTRLLQRLR